MSTEEIASLPVEEISNDKSVCFLWTVQRFLPKAFEVLSAWGFRYQRTLTWDKKNGICLFGFHHRTEFILFGYKGRLETFPKQKAIPTILTAKSPRHSAKPDKFYSMVSHLGKKRIDLFARKRREGWTCWGDEIT